jgi:hypothetical protein
VTAPPGPPGVLVASSYYDGEEVRITFRSIEERQEAVVGVANPSPQRSFVTGPVSIQVVSSNETLRELAAQAEGRRLQVTFGGFTDNRENPIWIEAVLQWTGSQEGGIQLAFTGTLGGAVDPDGFPVIADAGSGVGVFRLRSDSLGNESRVGGPIRVTGVARLWSEGRD